VAESDGTVAKIGLLETLKKGKEGVLTSTFISKEKERVQDVSYE